MPCQLFISLTITAVLTTRLFTALIDEHLHWLALMCVRRTACDPECYGSFIRGSETENMLSDHLQYWLYIFFKLSADKQLRTLNPPHPSSFPCTPSTMAEWTTNSSGNTSAPLLVQMIRAQQADGDGSAAGPAVSVSPLFLTIHPAIVTLWKSEWTESTEERTDIKYIFIYFVGSQSNFNGNYWHL